MAQNRKDETGCKVDVGQAVADEFRHGAVQTQTDDAGAVALSDMADAADLSLTRE